MNTNARFATVTTALKNADGIHVQHMQGTEELGRPFEFEVELLHPDKDLKLDDQLGKSLTVTVDVRNDKKRHFNGIVSQMSYAGPRGRLSRYIAVLRPWIWYLSFSSDNRIFQEKSAPDIIEEIFKAQGQPFRNSLTRNYDKRDYCVQYGETDFDFVSRLMEEEGMYYFFEHSKDKHELILADSPSAHKILPDYAKVQFFPPEEHHSREEDHISHWELLHQVETHVAVVDSYDFENPSSELKKKSKVEAKGKHGQSGHEIYEYGSLYTKAPQGDTLSKIMAEEQLAGYQVASGGGDVMGISSGFTFELEGYTRTDQNRKYLTIGANIQLVNNEFEAGVEGEPASFNCFFRAIPDDTQFRPARVTPRGLVRGPQTAVVVGPSGDEIHTDEYGRVKVQFHWDREGEKNEKSSCWMRVSTALAGKNWGMIAIPRIGQEVIVDFLEGNPDQPIIVGSVYNKDQMPPYKLPDNQTQSGLKSRSSPDGTGKNFNELRFEDKKDKEEVFLHAERDMKRVVKNDDTLEVGLETKDKGDQKITIHRNRTSTLKTGSDTLTIQQDRTTTLKEGDDTLTIEKGDQTVAVKKGSQKIDVKKKIDIKAGDQLSITVGQAKLTMKKNGEIKIKGMNISVNGTNIKIGASVKLQAEGKAQAQFKGAMTKVEGSGILDLKAGGMAKLKGGITMIG